MNLLFVSIFTAALITAPQSRAEPRDDLWCASLLADPGATLPENLERLRRAILVPYVRFGHIRHHVSPPSTLGFDPGALWRRWTDPSRPHVRLEQTPAGPLPRELARAIDVGHDRLKAAHNATFAPDLRAYPVRRLAVGEAEVRAYLRAVRTRAESNQWDFDARVVPRELPKEPSRFGGLARSTVGALAWSSVSGAICALGIGALQMHWSHVALGLGAVGVPTVGLKVLPRVYRVYLEARGTFESVAGRHGPVGSTDFARAQARVMDEIERALDDPARPRDLLIYAAARVELPLGTGEVSPVARRAPSAAELLEVIHRRGAAPVPVDARRFETDLAFFYDDDEIPTLFSLAREPGYFRDR